MSKNIAVIGDGAWGTALALLLKGNGHEVRVWGPFADKVASANADHENKAFLPGVKLPEDLHFHTDPQQVAVDASVVILATPSQFYSEVLDRFQGLIDPQSLLVSVTKGLDLESQRRMTEIAREKIGATVAALSGPSFADEVARGLPTAVVIACEDLARAERLQRIFSNDYFRAYTSDDVVGTELGGALKNIVAIAAGVSDGIGYGYNSKAALITRGLAEIKRLGCALGARPETFAGLSGMGDLLLTCTGKLSRNRGVGERLGRGEKIEDILASMQHVAEGVWNCSIALQAARAHSVEVPITEQVNAIIHQGKNPRAAVHSLLERDLKSELEE